MKPSFKPGKNIALKVPSHEHDATVHFYQEILGLERLDLTVPGETESAEQIESIAFDFDGKNLWVDRIDGLSQAEIWLEIVAEDIAAAQNYLQSQGCVVRNEIEPLPGGFMGFWLSGPSNIIHLVNEVEGN